MVKVIDDMIGKVYTSVTRPWDDGITFENESERVEFYHIQDCCEDVWIEDITGNLSDLEGAPIIMAEEAVSIGESKHHDSVTWTFYKFATAKGYVTVRWYGTSNGWYSESVDILMTRKDEPGKPRTLEVGE